MAKSAPINNLRDMIAFIEDANLQRDFFELHAPHISINWNMLPPFGMARADKLSLILEEQRRKDSETESEYDAIFSELRTIALVNAESENWGHLQNIMETKMEFHRFYNNFFGTNFSPKSANLAVFINLVSHGVIKDTSEIIQRQASEIWKEILARASTDIQQAKLSAATTFEPNGLVPKDRERYFAEFENELRHRMRGQFGKTAFYVAVHPIYTREITHYVVTTSPLPHSVVVVNKEETDTATKTDDHAKTFEIIVDEFHNRVHSSKTVLIGYIELAECFIRCVLRSRQAKNKRLSYQESLQKFRQKDILNSLKLPKEIVEAGAKVWIDSLDVRLLDTLLPTIFRGDEERDIYSEIENQIDIKRFPYNGWGIVGATIKVRLPGTSCDNEITTFKRFVPGEKTYTVKIGEGSFSIPSAGKSFNRLHLDILESLEESWGLKGLDRSQKQLGKKSVSVQGELMP